MRKLNFSYDKVRKVFGEDFDPNRRIYETYIPITYDFPLTISMLDADRLISEGLIMTYPFEKMRKHILKYFNIPMYYWHEYDGKGGVRCCAIDYPKEYGKFTMDKLIKAMELYGYFKSQSTELDTLIRMHFEPKFEEDTEVDRGEFLYHVTHHSNIMKIMRIGLCPSNRNKRFNYPSRVYFLRQNATEEEIRNVAMGAKMSQDKELSFDGLYCVLKVYLNELPSDVHFHNDPNLNNGVYTTSNIPPSAIDKDVDYVKV